MSNKQLVRFVVEFNLKNGMLFLITPHKVFKTGNVDRFKFMVSKELNYIISRYFKEQEGK